MRICPSGFREYDVRWRYPDQIDLEGVSALGLALGTQLLRRDLGRRIVVGHDYRSYAPRVKDALVSGLVTSGAHVLDIGLCLSPTAYFAQFHLDSPAVAMVTASHNPNGWTGVKMGFDRPCTHGPEDIRELQELVEQGGGETRPHGRAEQVLGVQEAYLDDLSQAGPLPRPLRAVVATGNGTAGVFAPDLLRRIGVDVIELHCDLDHSFPNYNPNPEAMEMQRDMARAVQETGADLAFGFDGDGDRCGVVDGQGQAISSDKLGLFLARALAKKHRGARFLADVKSTALFATDPVLKAAGAQVEYWITGHSHMKRRLRDTGGLAAFEKSGHHFLAPPIGRGYDCGLRVAVELCRALTLPDARPLKGEIAGLGQSWISPTMSPHCDDVVKYQVVDRLTGVFLAMKTAGQSMAGRRVMDVLTVNGARVQLEDGSWALVRASSNTPNLVVVCESLVSEADLKRIFKDFDKIIRSAPEIGPYDQRL
ncbi:Phosphomannomutase/phosphoglucomutase [Aliiroseovarius pelagivivens]|uniref:Phosphomannomutase/phosphoglucomutase n=1 Tax=Aliiroseovarius pelagivivens TaxID=1639690 RepID=A0A2R8AIL6_9RHOB|nr:phosphomannomutase/phosphoglucomutase [Aliiroseovarius pelagivivens]SPF75714.1 Phosphomannomutase/phosphoglucomutase [Aliiroseovarius pelagivivens]